MQCTIDNRVVLRQAPEGPLAKHIGSFAESVRKQGYAAHLTHRMVMLAACFSRWLKQQGVSLCRVTSNHSVRYLQYRSRRVKLTSSDVAALRYLIDYLRSKGAIPVEVKPSLRPIPAERCARGYEEYLHESRALAETSVISYMPFIRDFLKDRFGNGRVSLTRLRASDVVGFVQSQAARMHLKRAKLMASALRSFLQFARLRGDVTLDLAAAVPAVANWSMPAIPRAITAAQVRALLASINRRTAIGRRDYAILLLLARLGLRASEVVLLDLDDLDWNAGQLRVHGKSGQRSGLPLSTERVAKQLPPTYNADGQIAPVAAYFCAPKVQSAASGAQVPFRQLFDIRSSAQVWMRQHAEHINFATDWLPTCCAAALHLPRLATCWGIAIHRQR